jgi:hypothetical protein
LYNKFRYDRTGKKTIFQISHVYPRLNFDKNLFALNLFIFSKNDGLMTESKTQFYFGTKYNISNLGIFESKNLVRNIKVNI